MLNKILGTFSSKLLTAVINLLIMVLTTQYLGADGKGETSLIIANITLIQLLNHFVGGTALVYLIPRNKTWVVLVPAYIWAVFSCGLGTSILYYSGQVSQELIPHIFFLALLFSFFSIHQMVFMGKRKIKWHNILSFVQVLITLVLLWFFFYVQKNASVNTFLRATYGSYGTICILSTIITWSTMDGFSIKGLRANIRTILSLGFVAQISSIIAFLNNRLSYYMLEHFKGESAVGIYSTALSVVESSSYMFSRSIAMVQYSHVANESNDDDSIKLTNSLTKISFWAAVIVYVILLVIPPSLYTFIFGKDFTQIHKVIQTLWLSVLSISCSTTFLHYFSGKGKYHLVNIATGIALVFTIGLSFLLIPAFGIMGAGITMSIAYLAQGLYLYIQYRKVSNFRLKHLFHIKEEIAMIKNWFNKKQRMD